MTQPTALYLADVLANDPCSKAHHDAAAAELRRLYRVSEDLRESLNHKSYYQARLTKHMREMKEHMREMKVQRDELLEALERSRAQWIHSVNAEQCLAAIAKAEKP